MDERRFEILATTFVSRFYAFYVIKFESKQFCEIFVVNSLNYCFFKRFLLINLNKVVFWRTQIDTPIRCPICVLSVFDWLSFHVSKYFILRFKKIHFIYHLVTLTEEMLSTKFATEQTSSNAYSLVTRNIKRTIKNISSLTQEKI